MKTIEFSNENEAVKQFNTFTELSLEDFFKTKEFREQVPIQDWDSVIVIDKNFEIIFQKDELGY